MDEPTSDLDARAAAFVMCIVRNTVDTGRTIVYTIHQPSIDVFEAFDELLLMTRGGRLIYARALGRQSQKLIEYFEACVHFNCGQYSEALELYKVHPFSSILFLASITVSRDHKPDQTDERQQIEEAGGFVMWAGKKVVGGVLAVSHAFGDRLLKQWEGLGDVVTSLSRAVQDMNHNVEIILPKYDCMKFSQGVL
ncbi:pleiotropic drug resistance 11 [Perilla frutescens var. frutescens]|nr:pleiotropic drug resistance 11 [Perilla frutescens var. frutescens]